MNAIAQPEPAPQPVDIAIRMADEGIPVLAIARATHIPSGDVYAALRQAISRGLIVDMPRDDWPQRSTRESRIVIESTVLNNDVKLRTACARFFKLSPLEAAMLTLLLKRDEVTKEQLHSVIESTRNSVRDVTEIKMVDVMICKLRKKLVPHSIVITTMWGVGYFLDRQHRDRALELLLAMKEQ